MNPVNFDLFHSNDDGDKDYEPIDNSDSPIERITLTADEKAYVQYTSGSCHTVDHEIAVGFLRSRGVTI